MNFIWSPAAREDRRALLAHISLTSVEAAKNLDESISSALRLITQFPLIGRSGRLVGTREYVVHRHYILVYEPTPHAVRIVRLFHAGRNWP